MNGKVYVITCISSNKQYVGVTIKSIEDRWKRHIKFNYNKKILSTPIQLAIKKYGIENFKIELIESNITDYVVLYEKELYYANLYNTFSPNGYNLKAGVGRGSTSLETRERIGKSNRGRKASPETIKKLSDSHKGLKLSDDAKKKLSDFFKGKKPSDSATKALIEKLSKNYKFKSPDGIIHDIFNLRKFCRENNLNYPKMNEVHSGKRNQYKGWIKA